MSVAIFTVIDVLLLDFHFFIASLKPSITSPKIFPNVLPRAFNKDSLGGSKIRITMMQINTNPPKMKWKFSLIHFFIVLPIPETFSQILPRLA